MNTKGGGFYPPHEPPKHPTSSKCSSIQKIWNPLSDDVTFIAASEMFHESSSSDDDHRVKAWREMWLETYTYMEACVDL